MSKQSNPMQMCFTTTPELRRAIEAEAVATGLSVSSIVRSKLLVVYRDQIKELKQHLNESNE